MYLQIRKINQLLKRYLIRENYNPTYVPGDEVYSPSSETASESADTLSDARSRQHAVYLEQTHCLCVVSVQSPKADIDVAKP